MAHFFIFYTRLRTEEKLLFKAAEERGIPFSAVNVSDGMWPDIPGASGDVALCRCVSQTQNSTLAVLLESRGVLTVNSSDVMALCADKIITAAKLDAAGGFGCGDEFAGFHGVMRGWQSREHALVLRDGCFASSSG